MRNSPHNIDNPQPKPQYHTRRLRGGRLTGDVIKRRILAGHSESADELFEDQTDKCASQYSTRRITRMPGAEVAVDIHMPIIRGPSGKLNSPLQKKPITKEIAATEDNLQHFQFLSDIQKEAFIRVSYRVPVGIFLNHYATRCETSMAASLVFNPRDLEFKCIFYSKNDAGLEAMKSHLIEISKRSASFFLAKLDIQRYVPVKNINVDFLKICLRSGSVLIIHENDFPFTNKINFGEHSKPIPRHLVIPHWNSDNRVWQAH